MPKLRHHKATGQGYIVLNGRARYLGRYDLPETEEAYHRLIAEWIANGRALRIDPEQITVVELIARYWKHVQSYYIRRDGSPTSMQHGIKQALKPLRKLYGTTAAAHFGPVALRTVRQTWIDGGMSRGTVNSYTSEVRRLFKWAAAHELVPGTVFHALIAVEGLRAGRSAARETEPIKPVPPADIDEVKPYVSSQVWALIRLQLLTGARAGELVRLRAIDIDTTGSVWIATVRDHKTSYRHRERRIYLGPQAQMVAQPFMTGRALDGYLFSPREANAERKTVGAKGSRRPDQSENIRQTDRVIGDHYTTDSYRKAIERACKQAGVPRWTPHRLRHNAATDIRREFGLEAAQLILGHAHADVTQIYAEVNEAKALEIARRIG